MCALQDALEVASPSQPGGAGWSNKKSYTCSLGLFYHPLHGLKRHFYHLWASGRGALTTQSAAPFATFTSLPRSEGGSAGMATTQPK